MLVYTSPEWIIYGKHISLQVSRLLPGFCLNTFLGDLKTKKKIDEQLNFFSCDTSTGGDFSFLP